MARPFSIVARNVYHKHHSCQFFSAEWWKFLLQWNRVLSSVCSSFPRTDSSSWIYIIYQDFYETRNLLTTIKLTNVYPNIILSKILLINHWDAINHRTWQRFLSFFLLNCSIDVGCSIMSHKEHNYFFIYLHLYQDVVNLQRR